jgi:hypothetical protein
MSLAALRDVYNPLAIKAETKPPLQDWKESPTVIRLSEYLKIKSNCGIKLCQNDGAPCLVFQPGLKPTDRGSERWTIADNAVGLLIDAADDLKELISNGKLSLPKNPRVLPGG